MKYDREEAYLHEKLTGGLHPADVDLWPAVAEHLPDAPPARHPRWKLAICLAGSILRWMRICWREWWQTIMGRCQTMAGCR